MEDPGEFVDDEPGAKRAQRLVVDRYLDSPGGAGRGEAEQNEERNDRKTKRCRGSHGDTYGGKEKPLPFGFGLVECYDGRETDPLTLRGTSATAPWGWAHATPLGGLQHARQGIRLLMAYERGMLSLGGERRDVGDACAPVLLREGSDFVPSWLS
jgi:hypothetical protein